MFLAVKPVVLGHYCIIVSLYLSVGLGMWVVGSFAPYLERNPFHLGNSIKRVKASFLTAS